LDYVQPELFHGELVRFLSVLKPGIIFGNAVTLSGGFFLASHLKFDPILFILTLLSMACIVGSGCVFNNVVDRDIDRLMSRTCDRVLVKGLISPRIAFLYATLLGVVGFILLYSATNFVTVLVAAIGWIFYVLIYTLFFKRHSIWGTAIGAISGAVPPVMGYTAVTARIDWAACILFFILFFWQMPHFYAIAIYRLKDFKSADIPVLPAMRTMFRTKLEMMIYVVAYFVCTLLLVPVSSAGIIYLTIAVILGCIWIEMTAKGFLLENVHEVDTVSKNSAWARKVFLFSLIEITLLSIAMVF
jgi:protoheme IX farnesyltransferase